MMAITYTHEMPDKSEYFKLFESTGWNEDYGASADDLITVIENSSHFICAYDDSKLVGFARMISDGLLHAVIFDVIVLPDYQGRGIGRALMDDILEQCRKWRIRDIQLFCAKGKVGFYEKCGFKSRADNGPGMEIKFKY